MNGRQFANGADSIGSAASSGIDGISEVTVRTAGNPEAAGFKQGEAPKTETVISADVVELALRSRFNLDQNECGGFPLLVRQMMDAVGKYYAVHEIVWQPGDVLTAELRFVPLWFFENRSGRLQFLKLPLGGANGEPLEPGGWMITKGDGIMEACSIAYMFKNMPLKDWVSYSDKFGTPGVLGETNASKGSDAGNAMLAAVAAFGQNWSGVVYGSDGAIKEPMKLIQAKGEGTLPFPPLVERMDRAMASLWRGSDLSSMSADNKGASVQEDESDILIEDDATMISETLQLYIDRWVIWQKFGVKPLAKSVIVVPKKKDFKQEIEIDKLLLDAGARLGERERLEYYGRPLIEPDDTPLHAPTQTTERIQDMEQDKPSPTGQLPNVTFANARDTRVAGKLMARARDLFPEALGGDLAPLRRALAEALAGPEDGLIDRAEALYRRLGTLGPEIVAAKNSEIALYKILSAAIADGLSTDSQTSA